MKKLLLNSIVLSALFLFSEAQTTHAQGPFLDEFSGTELDPSWIIFDNEGDTQKGFTGDGEYEIEDSQSKSDAGLGRILSGSGDFTADVSIRLQDFFEGRVDFKFRFLAPKFMELVFSQNDSIRVFSGETGGNTVKMPSFGYEDSTPMHIRFAWTESTGTMRIGVAKEDEVMELITTIDGLKSFQPTRLDLVLFRIGEGEHSPHLFIDRFEIQDEALPIGIPPFVDDFSGPKLDEKWTPLDKVGGASQIGFSDGIYEVKGQQNSNAGLRHSIAATGSFTANARVKLLDFSKSASDFKFRFLGGEAIELVYNSFDDIRVFSGEIGDNIARINKVGFQDGDVLSLKLAYDALNTTVQIGVAQNDGAMILLAEQIGLFEFTPDNVDLILFKFGEGNGNAPRLQLDHFEISSGFIPVEVQPISDEFDGPELLSSWTPIGAEAERTGFNDKGQYEIKAAQSPENAGLRLLLPSPGSTTVDLKLSLHDFVDSNSELRMRFIGTDTMEIIVGSAGTLQVILADEDLLNLDDFELADGQTLNLRFAWDALMEAYEIGTGINDEGLNLIFDNFSEGWQPRAVEVVLSTSGGNEKNPRMHLDSFSARPGFSKIPTDRLEPFLDDFAGPDLSDDWFPLDEDAQLGFSEGVYQFSDPSRSSGSAGIKHFLFGQGSFTVDANIVFEEFEGTGSDFKFRFFGGKFVELVLNSFDAIRMHSGEKGGINRIENIGIVKGEPVQFRFVWNEAKGQAEYGILIGEKWTLVGSVSGLTEFAPDSLDLVLFKFGDGPIPIVSIDRFEVRPGVIEIPTDPPIQSYREDFDGPEMAEGWILRDESGEAQIGFSNGVYELRDPSTSAGDVGLRRALEGKGGSFTAELGLTFDGFAGSATDFKFRFFGGKFIEVVYNSFDDLRVYSQEKGENVSKIQKIGINDGDATVIRFIWNESASEAIIGLAVRGEPMEEIAKITGLKEFTPDTADFVMFKFGEGNGSTPGLLVDYFEIRDGVFPITEVQPPVEGIVESFDGPELGEDWSVRDESAEAQIGFTGDGRYQVNEPSASAGGDAGIRRSFTSGGSFTADLKMHFEDFIGSHTDFKFRFFGGKFLELVFNSFDDVRVYSAEKGGNVNRIDDIGVTDGGPLHFRFIWDAETGNATYGVSIDGGAMLEIATAEGLKEFTPNMVDFVMFKFGEGNGNTPKMLVDHFEIRDGVFPITEVQPPAEGIVESFDGPELGED